jgi:hypothetical protein
LLPEYDGVRLYGWLQGGYLGNVSNPTSRFNGPWNSVDTNEAQFNQGYVVLERTLTDSGDFDLGGRVDLLYGSDFFLAQSLGFELNRDATKRWNGGQYYGLALPQMYAEVGTNRLSLKVGHFYSIVGYEQVPSVGNFFYTHSYSYMFAGPFTFWGGLATWKPCDEWSFQLGLTNGWNAVERTVNRLGVISNITYTAPSKQWTLGAAVTTGEEAAIEETFESPFANRTVYDVLWTCQWTRRLSSATLWQMGSQDSPFALREGPLWYGLSQYFYYAMNDTMLAGMRVEWFRDEDGVRVGLNRPDNPNKLPFLGSFYEISVGVNWLPMSNVRVRPELRWDWFDGKGKPFDDGNATSQFTLGFDAILQF